MVVASCSSFYTMYLVVLLQEIEAGNAYLAITAINLLTSLHGMQNSKYFEDGAYDRKRMLLYKSVLFCKALFGHFCLNILVVVPLYLDGFMNSFMVTLASFDSYFPGILNGHHTEQTEHTQTCTHRITNGERRVVSLA